MRENRSLKEEIASLRVRLREAEERAGSAEKKAEEWRVGQRHSEAQIKGLKQELEHERSLYLQMEANWKKATIERDEERSKALQSEETVERLKGTEEQLRGALLREREVVWRADKKLKESEEMEQEMHNLSVALGNETARANEAEDYLEALKRQNNDLSEKVCDVGLVVITHERNVFPKYRRLFGFFLLSVTAAETIRGLRTARDCQRRTSKGKTHNR